MKKAIIVGVHGQDGRILFEQLERENYAVLGIGREDITGSQNHRLSALITSPLNILAADQVSSIVAAFKPDEIYYLAAFHHSSEEIQENIPALWQNSFDVHVRGLIHFLEAMKNHSPASRLFYAASSHVFGDAESEPQNEQTPFRPLDVYGVTKTAGIHCCHFYRKTFSLFAAAGILYNHESPLRTEKFVSRKIIRGARAAKQGRTEKLILGDLSARVDWGYAPDYVSAMRAILKTDAPEDFIVASGESHSVLEFVEVAFGMLGLDWKKHVEEKPSLITCRRNSLRGDTSKLRRITGWKPTVTFEGMIERLLKESDEPI